MSTVRSTARRKNLVEELVLPAYAQRLEDGVLAADFGKAAFGTLLVPGLEQSEGRSLVVHLGEKLGFDGRLDRSPPGSVRYRRIEQSAERGACRIVIPSDKRNTGPAAILMLEAIGEVLPSGDGRGPCRTCA